MIFPLTINNRWLSHLNLLFLEIIMILVFGEKSAIIQCCALSIVEHYQNIFPKEKIVFISSLYFINAPYAYPKNLKWSDFPYTHTPCFHLKPWKNWQAKTLNTKGELETYDLMDDELLDVKEFLFSGDPSGFSTTVYQAIVEQFFSTLPPEKQPFYTGIQLYALDDKSIQQALCEKENFYTSFINILNAGKISNYFTYNFNINSMAIFAPLLNSLGIKHGFISKYSLQLLYWFESNCMVHTEGDLIHTMHHWIGTGKYTDKRIGIGSSASRASIIESLLDMGLLCHKHNNQIKGRGIYLSTKGYEFLSLLHKDCCDQDLPFRLNLWMQEPFSFVQPKIDRYLNTFFGKQKRNMRV